MANASNPKLWTPGPKLPYSDNTIQDGKPVTVFAEANGEAALRSRNPRQQGLGRIPQWHYESTIRVVTETLRVSVSGFCLI